MQKKQVLDHWKGLTPNQPITPGVIPYKHQGSTFSEDSIRITGSQKFIDSVLSHLTELLAYEGLNTRLQLVYQESKDIKTGALTGSYNCYVQVHQRGAEAQMANAIMAGMKAKAEKAEQAEAEQDTENTEDTNTAA